MSCILIGLVSIPMHRLRRGDDPRLRMPVGRHAIEPCRARPARRAPTAAPCPAGPIGEPSIVAQPAMVPPVPQSVPPLTCRGGPSALDFRTASTALASGLGRNVLLATGCGACRCTIGTSVRLLRRHGQSSQAIRPRPLAGRARRMGRGHSSVSRTGRMRQATRALIGGLHSP